MTLRTSVRSNVSHQVRVEVERANRRMRDAISRLEAQKKILRKTQRALENKNRELNELMDTIKSGKIDTLYGTSTASGAVRIQDAGLVEENERLVAELKRSNQKFRQIFEYSNDAIAVIDDDGNILDANSAAERMWGCSRAEIVKSKIINFCVLGDTTNTVGFFAHFNESVINAPADQKKSAKGVNGEADTLLDKIIEVRLDNGHIVEMSLVPINWDDRNIYLATLHDITVRKNSEEKLLRLVQYDQLTGLANRTYCLDYLAKVLARAKRHKGCVAVLFLDLDKFKDVNDSLGHDEGDRLLKSVAGRLGNFIRESDLAVRFGGDEFALILDEIKQHEDAGLIAQKIIDVLKTPHTLNNTSVIVGCSIGIATYPICGEDAEELFKAADIAMFHAKNRGRNQYCFFVEDMQRQLAQRIHIEQELSYALERNELVLYYQPKVDVRSGAIVAMEALLRWNRRDDGLIAPDQFIPLAEKTGLIVDIGEWVLRTACKQIQVWQDKFNGAITDDALKLAVAVNVSNIQLKQGDFGKKLKLILQETNSAPNLLELEITESIMMDNPTEIAVELEQMRRDGIDIAMDDFGTGYSSFSYLRRLSLSTLKIDKTFIAEIGHDDQSEMIIRTIIGMAHNLNLRVVAEGVETVEQVAFLQQNRCDLMQGFYFAKPMSSEQASLLLQEGVIAHHLCAQRLPFR